MGLAGIGGVLVTTLNPILTSLFVFLFLDRSTAKLKEFIGLIISKILKGALLITYGLIFPLNLSVLLSSPVFCSTGTSRTWLNTISLNELLT